MACDISMGRQVACKDASGGLDAVYFINGSELSFADLTFDNTNTDVIESVTGTPNAFKWEVRSASDFTQNIVTNRDNGTTHFEQVLNLTFTKLDVDSHKQIKLLSWGNPKVIVKDNNGNFFLMGAEFGADVTGGTVVTGNALGDLSGYTLTLTAMERTPAYFFEATTEAGLGTAGITVIETVVS
jgi:hypothetical protein